MKTINTGQLNKHNDTTDQTLLKSFQLHLQMLNRSPSTLNNYTQTIESFIENTDVADVTQATTKTINAWVASLFNHRTVTGKPYSKNTISLHVRAVKRFYEFLKDAEYIAINPAEIVKEPKKENGHRPILSTEQVKAILNQPDQTTLKGIRDRTILELFYSTGIRKSELLKLDLDDIDLSDQMLRVVEGKGGKDRIVPIGSHANQYLGAYISKVRPVYTKNCRSSQRLFVTVRGKPLSSEALMVMIKKYAAEAGVDASVSPHVFRRVFATELIRNGADIVSVQRMMGHECLSTTQTYIQSLGMDIKTTHDKTHPREKYLFTEESIIPEIEEKNLKIQGFEMVLTEFETSMKIRGLSPKTIKDTTWHVRHFIDFIKRSNINEVSGITKAVIKAYQVYQYERINKHGKHNTPRYRNMILQALKQFTLFLRQAEYLKTDPAQDIVYAKEPKQLPRSVLSVSEAKKILLAPDTTSLLGYRDRVMLEVLYSSGIRKFELENLMINNVDYHDGFLQILNGKGGKDRIVPIGRIASTFLKHYIMMVRPEFVKDTHNDHLFLSLRGNKMNPNLLLVMVKKYAEKAGIKKTVSCHTFRHSCASSMLRNGANIRIIQELLGHASLSTTQIYTHVTINDLKKIHSRCHPREKA